MKKVFFSIAIVAVGLFVASCGNKNGNNAEAADSATVAEEATSTAVELEEEGVGPGILTTEKFVVDVPEGWKVIDKKGTGYIRMRPSDNGFASFNVDEKEGDIAEAAKSYKQVGEKKFGDKTYTTYEWGDYGVAMLKLSDTHFVQIMYKEIDDAVLEKVISSIKYK